MILILKEADQNLNQIGALEFLNQTWLEVHADAPNRPGEVLPEDQVIFSKDAAFGEFEELFPDVLFVDLVSPSHILEVWQNVHKFHENVRKLVNNRALNRVQFILLMQWDMLLNIIKRLSYLIHDVDTPVD